MEEQFYLTIPLALWLLWRREKRRPERSRRPGALSLFAAVYHMGNLNANSTFTCFTAAPGNSWRAVSWPWLPPLRNRAGERWLRLAGVGGILLPFAHLFLLHALSGLYGHSFRRGGRPF